MEQKYHNDFPSGGEIEDPLTRYQVQGVSSIGKSTSAFKTVEEALEKISFLMRICPFTEAILITKIKLGEINEQD